MALSGPGAGPAETPGGNARRGAWSPAGGLVLTAAVAAALTLAWFAALLVTGSDPAGLLLAGVAGVGLGVGTAFGIRARPRLLADPDGLTVRGLLGSSHHPWPFVTGIRVRRTRRWGRTGSLLEIDTVGADGGERLLVFGRLDLAADPDDVTEQLSRIRP